MNENENKEHPLLLIIEDDPTNIKLLEEILKKDGYRTILACNGAEALDTAEEALPDLILLDILMPSSDGFETCRRLKTSSYTKDIPVILLTAKTKARDIVKGFGAGAVDYITKPFNTAELSARVSTHIELKRNRDGIFQANEQLKHEIEEKNMISLEKDQLIEELKKTTVTDSLTELYNYTYIVQRLSTEISEARRYFHDLSIAVFDIDNLKEINENYGHKAGDEALTKTAFTLVRELREVDIVARYGGDEFLVVMPNTNMVDGFSVADRLRKCVGKMRLIPLGMQVTISGGICAFGNENAANFITRAENLLDKAKQSGRNIIVAG